MILQSVNLLKYLDYRPKFIEEVCVRNISSKSSCNLCQMACPNKAIKVIRGGIEIKNNCKQCGLCVLACPQNALVDNGSDFLRHEDKIYVICDKNLQVNRIDKRALVFCLKKLKLKLLLNLSNRGINTIVTNMDKCGSCEEDNCFAREVMIANKILDKSNREKIIIESVDFDTFQDEVKKIEKKENNKVVDRRDFFKSLMKESVGAIRDLAPPTLCVKSLQTQEDILIDWAKNKEVKLGIFNIKIQADKCIECRACIKLCPKGVWDEKRDELIVKVYKCSGCRLCQDICVGGAIEIERQITEHYDLIRQKTQKECNRCGELFATYQENKTNCPKCISKGLFNK